MEALRQHEPAAAEHLVITYGDRAYRLAIRITGNRQDAEEVVQDAFWAVIRKIHPSGVRLLALVIATPLVALSAPVAMAQPATGAAVLPLTASPPVPRIVVDAPLAEPLSRGVVFIRYRTEDLMVVPVFGPKALEMSPAVGHLHMALDGATWGWGNTSGEPIIIFGLPAGPHKVEITLVSPDHQPLARSAVEFVIPPRDAAAKGH